MCHAGSGVDVNVVDLKPVAGSACVSCHPRMRGALSHPVDVVPRKKIPAQLPLVEGRLNCLTCHFVHPSSMGHLPTRRALLRNDGRGVRFCGACHPLYADGHALFEKAHRSSCRAGSHDLLDAYTLQCVQCHDRHLAPLPDVQTRRRTGSPPMPGKHPVGVVFDRIAARRPRDFHPSSLLGDEIRLFDGRIGCGTCHSAYSKTPRMLVADNRKSALCLQCHIK